MEELIIMSNLKSKILSFFAWVFGLSLIVLGVAGIAQGALLGGFLFLIGGCLLLPPFKRFISDRKSSLSRGRLTVAGVALMFIASFAMSSDEQDASDIESVSSTENLLAEEIVDANDEEQNYELKTNDDRGVSSFNAEQYSYLPAKEAQMFFLFAYLKLAADVLDDEEYLTMRNIQEFRSGDAFKRKSALDKVETYRDEFRIEDIPTKIAVKYISDTRLGGNILEDIKIKPNDEFTVYQDNQGTADAIGISSLGSYDFQKMGFKYETNNYDEASGCSIDYRKLFQNVDTPNLYYSNDYGLKVNLNPLYLNEIENDKYKNQCFFQVTDQELAAKIEAARVADNIVFTGINYYTLEFDGLLKGQLDANQINLHILNKDGSLSKALVSTLIVSPKPSDMINDTSGDIPNVRDYLGDVTQSSRDFSK